jgi:hypothetical protein
VYGLGKENCGLMGIVWGDRCHISGRSSSLVAK